ncbi:hypothetical protein SAMN05216378_5430 [Paenibacillus catalpae]|uniref:Uncharacterized protein n=2 Tax=Paenibacillus catalpae TaxID=1045775 RepID=A0A1I2GSV4_9BACL|nr:hypothetical protein SAMN05216378_5430 [Paenibacillus catalpae]
MYTGKRSSLLWVKWSCMILACLLLLVGFVYAYDKPGGIADWRYSRAAGYPGIINIPLGDTPEQAVQKFRQTTDEQVIYKEAIDGGVLVFTKRNDQTDGTDLGIEFVRKTWLGWKWVTGGSYGLSSVADEAVNYMSMPKFKGIHGPFPIVYGQIADKSITDIQVILGGDAYRAKIINEGVLEPIWYVELPSSADTPYQIEALNSRSSVVASKTIDDSFDSGSILVSK